MTEEEYIDSVRKDREESVKFFSSDNRAERELWVANEFLSNLGLSFLEKELEHVTDDPPDVRFNKAEFEIKEILDPGRRRHAEFKNALERAKNAKTTQELLENYSPKDIIYTEIYDLVEENEQLFTSKPEDIEQFCDQLDMSMEKFGNKFRFDVSPLLTVCRRRDSNPHPVARTGF